MKCLNNVPRTFKEVSSAYLVTLPELVILFFAAALITGSGCASQAQTNSSAVALPKTTILSSQLAEEFDPQSVRKDFLLIQPKFSHNQSNFTPHRNKENFTSVESKKSLVIDPKLDLGTKNDTAASTTKALQNLWVYHVQIIALNDKQSAQKLSEMLQDELGIPVIILPDNGLQLVLAGNLSSPLEAEELRTRIASMNSEFSDAFVVRRDVMAEIGDIVSESAVETQSTKEIESVTIPLNSKQEFVRIVGWRVLIHQSLNLTEAEQFRKKASKQLSRDDIEINFHEPWYKVEVGHFREETDAQALVSQAKKRGFPGALRVRAEVLVPKNIQ